MKKNTAKKKGTDIPLANIPERSAKTAYTDEFKTTAAKRVIAGESAEGVARDMKIPSSSIIHKWKQLLEAGVPFSARNTGPRKAADPGGGDIAHMLKQAVARAQKSRDERLDAAAMIVASDIGGKDGEALAKAIRAHQTKPTM